MANPQGMDIYAARLSSFSNAQPTTKKRTSNAKGSKTIKWPHKSPSPEQLAKAGFFFAPTTSCPDNATCFLCENGLDGWEESDDPIREHLNYSPMCGWAVNIAIEQAIESGTYEEEDPMSAEMLEARKSTFAGRWPHEGKRGWTCKTQKMIEAGWYYCPTPESDDFVKCPYCSLSLDGWEPKDKPYEEHQRRSPDCIFFILTQSASIKPVRGKKGRPSKASRVSTQSQATAINEDQSMIDDVADEGDSIITTATNMTTASILPRVGKKGGKAKKGKGQAQLKNIKVLTEEPLQGSSFVEPEDDDFEVKVEQSSKRSKKRTSDEMDLDENVEDAKAPAMKRRATRTRVSKLGPETARDSRRTAEEQQDLHMTDAEEMPPPELPKLRTGAKKGRKQASSTTRKVSTMSTASMASLRGVPADEVIDASLEADLNRPLTDEEAEAEELGHTKLKSRRLTRTRPGSSKVTASAAPLRVSARASARPAQEIHVEVKVNVEQSAQAVDQEARWQSELAENVTSVEENTAKPKTRGRKAKVAKKLSASSCPQEDENCIQEVVDNHETGEATKLQLDDLMVKKNSPAQKISKKAKPRQPSPQISGIGKEASGLSSPQSSAHQNVELESSMLTSRTAEDDSGHETDTSKTSCAPVKRGGRKASVVKKGKKARKGRALSRNIEDIVQAATQAVNETQMESMIIALPEHQRNRATTTSPDSDHSDGVEPAKDPLELSTKEKGAAKDTKAKVGRGRPKRKAESSVLAGQEEGPRPNPLSSVVDEHNSTAVQVEPFLSSRRSSVTFTPKILPPTPKHAVPSPTPSPQSSDAENQPPSSRPSQQRPPLFEILQSKPETIRVPLAASTPNTSPSRRNMASRVQTACAWTNVDLEAIFLGSPKSGNENTGVSLDAMKDGLTSPEKRMTVEEWIKFNAMEGEINLRNECERLVGRFEGEGNRALRALEGIICEQ